MVKFADKRHRFMKQTGRNTIFTVVLLLAVVVQAAACTSFIVSGKVTKDGRPMIFKNRDTGNLDNLVMQVKGERYKYIAVVAANDSLPREAWSGHNEAGFAIMNTAAYNLNGDEKIAEKDEAEGIIMRRALEICATLEDFEHLIDTISPRYSNANFGVIDANGGCAYYEVGLHKWKKFDANDPDVAPYGYLIRTNHAYSGDRSMDLGVERYMAINKYMTQASFAGALDAVSLLRSVPRILEHGLTGINLYDYAPADNSAQRFMTFVDFIPRYITSCAQLIQGVAKGENPQYAVAWTIIGSPLATVGMPLMITSSGKLPSVVQRGKDGGAQLCRYGLKLKERLFPLRTKSNRNYIDVAQLINKAGTGILQQIQPVESEIIRRGTAVVDAVRAAKSCPTKTVDEYYKWVDEYIVEQYSKRFGL